MQNLQVVVILTPTQQIQNLQYDRGPRSGLHPLKFIRAQNCMGSAYVQVQKRGYVSVMLSKACACKIVEKK